MKSPFRLFFLLVLACLAFGGGPAEAAAELQDIGFELFSWPQGSRWQFAVFEGTSTARSLQEIKSPKRRLDLEKLKGRIVGMPSGERVYWQVDKSRGLVLPPKQMVIELTRFAGTAGIYLLLPGQTKSDKGLEETQTDVQRIID